MDFFKVLALCLVGGFGIYHSVLHATYDVTPCKGLLKDGMYKVFFQQIIFVHMVLFFFHAHRLELK